jgi:hypothetical protein
MRKRIHLPETTAWYIQEVKDGDSKKKIQVGFDVKKEKALFSDQKDLTNISNEEMILALC